MTPPFGIEIIKAVANTFQFNDLQNVDWDTTSFLGFGAMPLSEMNSKGMAVEQASHEPQISQAVVMYEVRTK